MKQAGKDTAWRGLRQARRFALARGRAVLEVEHTHLARLEADGALVGGSPARSGPGGLPSPRALAGAMAIQDLRSLAATITPEDRERLREGAAFNLAIDQLGDQIAAAAAAPVADHRADIVAEALLDLLDPASAAA
mgnify:CR=1 FL=1